MLDERRALAKGEIVAAGEHTKYIVAEEVGRGASCIVYSAVYEDTTGHCHLVRLKECYPYYLNIERGTDGGLKVPPSFERAFADARKKFERAYAKNVALKNTLGLINSTMDAVDLFAGNHTWYSVMTCVEGKDYRSVTDESLQSLFVRMLALARIIKKYHDHGVLHLDIKPENIFLIPETKEHMVLFDFDSLVEKAELANGTEIRISFSDGYAAPELVRGYKNKICEATDIYSIGAVVFERLFGRTPTALDGALGFHFDFGLMKKKDERYQPDLFRKLSDFLHKTIATSIVCRYKSVDSLIPALEELIRISDVENTFLYHNFSYRSACFVGRKKELSEIGAVFDSGQQVLFLSGVGGIGKTELARRYAYENANRYRKVVFVPFADSVAETVCRDDLRIHGIEQGEEESSEQYFARKLAVLKTVVSPEDLVILDNFDVDSDDNLEELLECPCRFLITTREDFRDYGYLQTDVRNLGEMRDLLCLFGSYNPEEYDEEQQAQIRQIIELVDRHTMTVELIAKYLRTTGERPHLLLKSLMKKEGITSTEEIGIRHRKDRRLRAESIHRHLLILFDLSGFSAGQGELMRSLSLLGSVRIARERFCQNCTIENQEKELESLIRRGWIEYDADTDKISLHQIILDLVYHHMQPSAENCPHIVEAMIGYLQQSISSRVEQQVRERLMKDFIGRIRGKNLAYARLCVCYCEEIRRKKEYLEQAREICLQRPMKETGDLLQRIYRMEMWLAGREEDKLDRMMAEDDFDEDAYWGEKSAEICRLAEESYVCARGYREDKAYLGRFCVELAWGMDQILTSNLDFMVQDERKDYLDRILDLAVSLLDDAKSYLLEADLPLKEKRRLLERIQDFYNPSDYTMMYRCDYYGSTEIVYEYQQMIDSLRESENQAGDISFGQVDLSDMARVAIDRGEYQKALKYYQRAWQEGSEPYEIALRESAHIYLKMGDREAAITSLEHVLEIDRSCMQEGHPYITYTSYVCCELIDLLMEEGRQEAARRYCQELIDYNREQAEGENPVYYLKWLIAGNYRLFQMEALPDEREKYWEECIRCFSGLPGDEKLPEELTGFLIELADRQVTEEDKMEMAFAFLERAECKYKAENTIPFLDYIRRLCGEKPQYIRQKVRMLLGYGEALLEVYPQQEEEALSYAIQAGEQYEQSGLQDEYWYSRIHKTIAKCYSYCKEYDYDQKWEEQKKCNYLLLAERDAEGKPEEMQIELWKEAAREYQYVDQDAMEEVCYDRLFQILDPIRNQFPYRGFESYEQAASDQTDCYIRQKKWQQAGERILELYGMLADYYGGMKSEEDIRQSDWALQDKLLKYAGKLSKIRWEREAFGMYMVAMIAMVERDVLKRWQDIRKITETENEEKLCSEVSKVLHGTVTSQNVDDIIDIYEKVKPVLERGDELAEERKGFKEELEWFLARYRYQNIEFKR